MSDGMFILLLLITSLFISASVFAVPIVLIWEIMSFNPLLLTITAIMTISLLLIIMWRAYIPVANWILDKLGGERLKRILMKDEGYRRMKKK